MNEKTLVTYATRSGSTAGVAEAIARALREQGAEQEVPYAVDLRPVKEVGSLDGYAAVVLGSAIKFGQLMPEMTQFVQKNQAALSQKAVAVFAVHLMNLGADETSRQNRLAYLAPLRGLVNLKKEAFFSGVGDWKKVPFVEGMIGRMVKAPTGDLRDWDAIRAWADELRADGFAAKE